MKSKLVAIISLLWIMSVGFVGKAQTVHPKTNEKEPAIAVMYQHPELL